MPPIHSGSCFGFFGIAHRAGKLIKLINRSVLFYARGAMIAISEVDKRPGEQIFAGQSICPSRGIRKTELAGAFSTAFAPTPLLAA